MHIVKLIHKANILISFYGNKIKKVRSALPPSFFILIQLLNLAISFLSPNTSATLYVRLIVTHIGHTPNRKKVNTIFLCQGKFAGMIGQLIPSPSYSFIPHTLIDSLLMILIFLNCLTKKVVNTHCH